MAEIEKSGKRSLIVGYFLSLLKFLDLNSDIESHRTNPTYKKNWVTPKNLVILLFDRHILLEKWAVIKST